MAVGFLVTCIHITCNICIWYLKLMMKTPLNDEDTHIALFRVSHTARYGLHYYHFSHQCCMLCYLHESLLYVMWSPWITVVCYVISMNHCCMLGVLHESMLYVRCSPWVTVVCYVISMNQCCMLGVLHESLLYVMWSPWITVVCYVISINHCCMLYDLHESLLHVMWSPWITVTLSCHCLHTACEFTAN